MQVDRHWAVLRSLPDHLSERTTEEIWHIVNADGYEVSKRTLERDLEQLSSIFPIVQRTEGRTNYWSWESSAKIWIPGMSDEEALTLYMAERNLRTLLPKVSIEKLTPYFEAARLRLDSQPKPIRPWTKKFRIINSELNRISPTIIPEVLRVIQDAVLRDKTVLFSAVERTALFSTEEYIEKPVTRLLVSPLSIIQHRNDLYLIYSCTDTRKIEHIRICDIEEAVPMKDKFSGPEDFDPDDYIKTGALTARDDLPLPIGDWIELSGVFANHVKELANYTVLSRDHWSEAEGENHTRIKTIVRFTSELVDWLLSLGPDVQVTQPPSLRRYIAERVTKAAALYAGAEANETPQLTLRWFDKWKSKKLKCNKCGWEGGINKKALEPNENESTPSSEVRCPKCAHLLLAIDFSASQDEMLANWNILNDAAKGAILSQPERMQLLEEEKLKSPSQLPDLKSTMNYLTLRLDWNPDPEVSFSIWHGIRFIWVQRAQWGGYKEFVRIAEIIHRRYGNRIMDLKPTPEALGFLIGNEPEGKQEIERARRLLSKKKK